MGFNSGFKGLKSRSASSHLASGSSDSQAIWRKLHYGFLTTAAVMPFPVTGIHKFWGWPTFPSVVYGTYHVSARLSCNHV